MPVEYFKAPKEVRILVKKIRRKWHKPTLDARIITLMRVGNWDKYATMGRVSAKQKKAGIQGDYILTINDGLWTLLERKQKRALIDHELVHCVAKLSKEGVPRWLLRHHDVEEFHIIVKRHGNWERGLKLLYAAARKHNRNHPNAD